MKGRGNVGPMGRSDKFKAAKKATSWDYFFHFRIVEQTSWLDISHVFSLQTTTAVTFEWEKKIFVDF